MKTYRSFFQTLSFLLLFLASSYSTLCSIIFFAFLCTFFKLILLYPAPFLLEHLSFFLQNSLPCSAWLYLALFLALLCSTCSFLLPAFYFFSNFLFLFALPCFFLLWHSLPDSTLLSFSSSLLFFALIALSFYFYFLSFFVLLWTLCSTLLFLATTFSSLGCLTLPCFLSSSPLF